VQRYADQTAVEKSIEYIISDTQDYGIDQRGNIVEFEGRRWGLIGRTAYRAITSPQTYRIDDVDVALDYRRQLRRARRAEMRSWKTPRKMRVPRRSVDARIYVSSAIARRLLAAEVRRARKLARRYDWPPPLRRL